MTKRFRDLSLWWDTLDELPDARASLGGDLDVDVAIVGGGYTGLWTARSLLQRDPGLRVLVIEAEVCGFGASGRNGGWASALFAASDARIAREHGLRQSLAMRAAMNDAVIEVGRAAFEDGIECDYQRGGTLVAARSDAQRARCADEIDEARALGIPEEDLRWMDAEEARAILGAEGMLGGVFTPHCAVIHPAKLVVGLAASAERLGATIVEGTRAIELVPGVSGRRPQVRTAAGTVTADVVVRATEGWSSQLPGSERAVIPVYSLMIATEPLSAEQWETIGLAARTTFSDHRHLVIYGQRTRDGRLAFGGRGAPYHYGSKISPGFDRVPKVFDALQATLEQLFPSLRGTTVTHRWGGPLGIPRDWFSSVGLDRSSGMAWAGGYVGDGVTTTNLAGRTLADLIVGDDTDLVALPWVQHRSPSWEPEPLRWIGVNAGLAATRWADVSETRRGRPSWLAEKMAGLLGG